MFLWFFFWNPENLLLLELRGANGVEIRCTAQRCGRAAQGEFSLWCGARCRSFCRDTFGGWRSFVDGNFGGAGRRGERTMDRVALDARDEIVA